MEIEYWKDYYKSIAHGTIQPKQMHEHPKYIKCDTTCFNLKLYHDLKHKLQMSGSADVKDVTDLYKEG